jgi:ribosomal-protein-serine acetyltransferase
MPGPVARKGSSRLVRRHPARIRVDEEIELRLLRERDASELFNLTDRNREYLRRWLPWVDATRSPKDTLTFIKTGLDQLTRNDGFQVGIWYRGQLAGALGYHYWNWPNRKTEIGYWLAASFQGKGVMTRACGALVDYAFGKLGLNRVEIRAAAGNTRSRAVPERLGFVLEGVLREAEWTVEGPDDQVVYGLLRKDWQAARKEGPRSL